MALLRHCFLQLSLVPRCAPSVRMRHGPDRSVEGWAAPTKGEFKGEVIEREGTALEGGVSDGKGGLQETNFLKEKLTAETAEGRRELSRRTTRLIQLCNAEMIEADKIMMEERNGDPISNRYWEACNEELDKKIQELELAHLKNPNITPATEARLEEQIGNLVADLETKYYNTMKEENPGYIPARELALHLEREAQSQLRLLQSDSKGGEDNKEKEKEKPLRGDMKLRIRDLLKSLS